MAWVHICVFTSISSFSWTSKYQPNLTELFNICQTHLHVVSRLCQQLMLVSIAVYQGWPGYDLMWRWGALSPLAAREGAALSELPLTGGRSRLHAGLRRAADRWSDGSIKPFWDGPRDRGCWEGSQSRPGPCSLSLASSQAEWLVIQTLINLWPTGHWSKNRWGPRLCQSSDEGNVQQQIKRFIFTLSAWSLGVRCGRTWEGKAYKTNRWLIPLGRSNRNVTLSYWMLLIITFSWNQVPV